MYTYQHYLCVHVYVNLGISNLDKSYITIILNIDYIKRRYDEYRKPRNASLHEVFPLIYRVFNILIHVAVKGDITWLWHLLIRLVTLDL